jgi:hypothetical protein
VVVAEGVVVELDDVVVAEPDDVEEVDELVEVVVDVPSLELGDVEVVEELVGDVVEDNLVLDEEDVVRMVEEELGEEVVDEEDVVRRVEEELDEVVICETETTEVVEGLEPNEPLTNLPKSESGTK